jgi:hypothetical protein
VRGGAVEGGTGRRPHTRPEAALPSAKPATLTQYRNSSPRRRRITPSDQTRRLSQGTPLSAHRLGAQRAARRYAMTPPAAMSASTLARDELGASRDVSWGVVLDSCQLESGFGRWLLAWRRRVVVRIQRSPICNRTRLDEAVVLAEGQYDVSSELGGDPGGDLVVHRDDLQ